MVLAAGSVGHQSEIRRGSGEASDWIEEHGEQTELLGGRMNEESGGKGVRERNFFHSCKNVNI